jgi:hypothetical protein
MKILEFYIEFVKSSFTIHPEDRIKAVIYLDYYYSHGTYEELPTLNVTHQLMH